MAICGTDCLISINANSNCEGHAFSIATSATEQDVRAFGDGDYGSWLACAKAGTITVKTYEKAPGVDAGEVVNVICNLNTSNLTATNTVCTGVNVDVDAKGLVEYNYTFRCTGDITGW